MLKKGNIVITNYGTGPYRITNIIRGCTCGDYNQDRSNDVLGPPHMHITCEHIRDTTRSKCYLNAYDEETLKSICCKNFLTIIDEGTPEPEQLVLFGG